MEATMKLFRSEVVKQRFQNFSNATTIHGFFDMFHAKSVTGTLFWVVMVFAAFSVTIVQLYNSISQYIDQDSTTVIAPALKGELFYPPMRLCYVHWLYWVDWEKAFSMSFTKESILFGLSYITRGFSSTVFNITGAKEDFVAQLSSNNLSTLSDFYEAIAKVEPEINGVKTIQFYYDQFDFIYKDPNIVFCYSVSGDKVFKILNEQGYANKLNSTKFGFSVPDLTYNSVKQHITEEEYNHHLVWWLAKNSHYYVDSVEQFNKNLSAYALPILLYPDGYSAQSVQLLHDNDAYTINLRASAHRWKNTDQNPCSLEKRSIISDNACQTKCMSKQNILTCMCPYIEEAMLYNKDTVENQCPEAIYFLPMNESNFRPQILNFFDKSTIVMGDKEYKSGHIGDVRIGQDFFDNHYPPCSPDKKGFNLSDCLNQCVTGCELWNYEMSIAVATMPRFSQKISFKNLTDIIIKYPTVGDVLIMTEIDPQTWENFVGNVGGLLGIWTGASILSFIQMFYLCCFYDSRETSGCGIRTDYEVEQKQ